MALTIPDRKRPEWKGIVTGKIKHKYSNYVLQTKVHQLQKSVIYKRITVETAVNDLYKLCSKYSLVVQKDFLEIFKTW